MDKPQFAKLVEKAARTYTAYSNAEKGALRKVFLGIADLSRAKILNYSDVDYQSAAEKFNDAKRNTGQPIDYSLENYLHDKNTPKYLYSVTDDLYTFLSNASNAGPEKERNISLLICVCLNYLYREVKDRVRGTDGEYVANNEDNLNLIWFDELLDIYEPKHAKVIMEKMVDVLNLNLDHGLAVSYTMMIRDYLRERRSGNKVKTIPPESLSRLLGNGVDGNIGGNGILGHLEACAASNESLEQSGLNELLDRCIFGTPE